MIWRILLPTLILFNANAYTILIDPGHGGEDLGAVAQQLSVLKDGRKVIRNIYEKDLSLQVANLIIEKLKQKHYRVFLTRSFDRVVSLEERAEIAEQIKADLFISIHFNSSLSKRSNGFETYYLDNHSDLAVKKVEDVENKGLQGEALIIHKIITDLVVEKTVESSKKLSESIHQNIKKRVKPFGVRDRGLKPGLFYVLALSKRPGVLLEMGFLSNEKELKKMIDSKYQKSYATGVVEGIDQYMLKHAKKPVLF